MECRIPDMDLEQIAASGQCFRMGPRDGGFCVIAGERYLEIGKSGENGECFHLSCSPEEWDGFWSRYFDLETDYGAAKNAVDPEDAYLKAAAEKGWGIRILRQDLWEMIITFIISQRNNIPRIRRCVELLCRRFGKRMENFRGEEYFAFPQPQDLAGAAEEELRDCNLGYRAGYILETARMVNEGRFSLEKLYGLEHEQARDALMELKGVGIKVAECVCLFGLHHLDAFPVDTHIAQALKNHYPQGFPFERYGCLSGILQQYIFFYELGNGGRKPEEKKDDSKSQAPQGERKLEKEG